MAQKPFFMDAGIRVGDWVIYQDSAGDLQVAPANVVNLPQKPFEVDKGFSMGQFAWYQVDDDLKMSEDDSVLTQRPFIVDAGVRVGDWIIHVNTDAVIEVALASSVTALQSGVLSSTDSAGAGQSSSSGSSSTSSTGTTLTGGEAFATGWAWTYWATASDSTTSNPQVQIRVNNTQIDSDWETALDNWSTGDSIEVVTPADLAGTTLTATGTGITTSTSGNYTIYYFDVSNAPSSSTYLYQVEHTTSGSSTPSYTYSIALTDSSGQAVTSVDEGSTYTLTVTTDAPDGTSVWLTSQADNESEQTGDAAWIDWLMNGTQSVAQTATVTSGVATTTLAIIADETTEAGYEKFRFVVSSSDDGVQWSGDGADATPWITIVDSSQDSSTPTYAIDIMDGGSSASSLVEGNSYTIEVTTTGVANGTVLYVQMLQTSPVNDPYRADFSHAGDSSLYTMFVKPVTITNNSGSTSLDITADYVDESANWEGLRATLRTHQVYADGTELARSSNLQIIDV